MSTDAHEPTDLVPIPKAKPGVEVGHIAVPECPVIPRKQATSLGRLVMWSVIAVLVCGMLALFIPNMRSNGMFLMPMMFIFPFLMMQGRGNQNQNTLSRSQVAEIRRKTLADLDVIRDQLLTAAAKQRAIAERLNPDPGVLCGLVGSPRMWERSSGVADYARHFGEVRIGVGTARNALKVLDWGIQVSSEGDPAQHEPLILEALNRLQAEQTFVTGVPIAGVDKTSDDEGLLPLLSTQIVNLEGEPEAVYGLVRSMICQAAFAHSPLDLKIMLIGLRGEREWIKWLPHACDEKIAGTDLGGPGRLMWDTAAQMRAAVDDELRHARTLYTPGSVFDGPRWFVLNDTDFGDDWDIITGGHITGYHTGAKGCTFVNLKAGTDG